MAGRDPEKPSKPAATRGGSGLAGRLRDLTHLPRDLTLARLGYDLKRPVFALPIYRYSLTGVAPSALMVTPSDPWPGNAELGAAIVQGSFTLSGQRLENQAPLWAPAGASAEWLAQLHGFTWLRDLRAAGGDGARRCTRDLVESWLNENGTWNALAWEPLATGQRLANWLGCYEFFAASAAIEFRHRLLRSMSRQTQHLLRVLPAGLSSAELIAALKGVIYAGACLPGGEAWRTRGLTLLARELSRQVLADGGHIERSPLRHLGVLRDLIDLRATLHKAEARAGRIQGGETHSGRAEAPEALHSAIEAMAPALRMFQHGDGGLALFNGSTSEEGWQIDMALQRAGGRRRAPATAPESGFQRLRAGRTLILVDAGAPPPAGFDHHAHAGTLSLEISVGRERLIVNCGARPGDPTWRWAQRTTAAHSTLVLGETNSSELLTGGGMGRRAGITHCRYEETDGNHWLDVSHDGYARPFGMIHRRRLYLTADGADIRGEDRLEPSGSKPRGGGFVLRFHLHPEVRVNLAQGGDAALLRLPKGGGWQMRAEGAAMSLEPSIYLGQGGEIRRGQQIVFSSEAPPNGAIIKWALRRIERQHL